MVDDEAAEGSRDETGREATERSMPLEDLAERIRRKDSDADGVDTEAGSDDEPLFEDRSIENIDSEAVWESLEPGSSAAGHETQLTGAEHVVQKRWYCERCEYFNEPPVVRCNHDGTEIVEFVGTDRVRVRNCPVVDERQALGDYKGNDIHPTSN